MGVELSRIPLLLLAGGKSSRLGTPKGLVRTTGGMSWIEAQLRGYQKAGGQYALVVLGFHAPAYQACLDAIEVSGMDIQSAINPDPERGSFSSLQEGLGLLQLTHSSLPVFVLPIDVPCPPPMVWQLLAESSVSTPHAPKVSVPTLGGKGGHPVLLSAIWAETLLQVPNLDNPAARLDVQMRLLAREDVARVEVPFSEGATILKNLNTPEDWRTFRAEDLSTTSSTVDVAGQSAALLSAIEVGLGSILHSFRVPLAGHFLSLNQGFILSRTVLAHGCAAGSRGLGFQISSIAAILKSLSPAGKKLTPMLALSAQGFLFSLGTLVFGANPVGITVGSILMSVWAFIQPVLIYAILYGQLLGEISAGLYAKTRELFAFEPAQLIWVIAAMVGAKGLIAFFLSIAAWRMPESRIQKFQARLLSARTLRRAHREPKDSQNGTAAHARNAWRDLFNPLFVFSLMITAAFFYFSEASASKLIWAMLRPIAVGFLLFFAIRAISFKALLQAMDRSRFPAFLRFSRAFRTALQALKEF